MVLLGGKPKRTRKGKGQDDMGGAPRKTRKAGAMLGGKSANPWINHVKHFAEKHKISYPEAMQKAKASYKKTK